MKYSMYSEITLTQLFCFVNIAYDKTLKYCPREYRRLFTFQLCRLKARWPFSSIVLPFLNNREKDLKK